ncbi:glycosyltransferase family 2 protein [Paenibacillus phocaensis]|uniref:glycosyltransferase family 2 protein n=1 Tax=Paenibacillus phocaensis TaxID=1776378 RepID=UPI000839B9D9|nr:glycosyltransferase family 2 protein [Paenibacillus phocaensis]
MKSPITVCILAKNEANDIRECIRSVISYVEEVVVLDTGSSDLTIEIATREGALVKRGDWANHFGQSRNELIGYATQPYILMMDADERLMDAESVDLENGIALLKQDPHRAGRVEIRNKMSDGRYTTTQITRLFPNAPEFQYSGRIHEQLLYRGAMPETYSTNIKLLHFGYIQQAICNKEKINRNLDLLFKQLVENPQDAYTLFQIGRTYSVNKQDREALPYLEKAYKSSNKSFRFYPSIIHNLAWVYLRERKWTELFSLIEVALKTYPDYTDLYYIYGSALIEMKNVEVFQLIPDAFEKCIELGESNSSYYETQQGVGTYLAHYNLGLYYELTRNTDKARYHYTKSSELGFAQARSRLTHLS